MCAGWVTHAISLTLPGLSHPGDVSNFQMAVPWCKKS